MDLGTIPLRVEPPTIPLPDTMSIVHSREQIIALSSDRGRETARHGLDGLVEALLLVRGPSRARHLLQVVLRLSLIHI